MPAADLPLSAIAARPDPGTRIYAIGDVHGRTDLLDPLLHAIRADADRIGADRVGVADPGRRPLLLFLGDYVDRGPDSRGVIDRLVAPPPPGFTRLCLMGNHEDFMMRFLDDVSVGPIWLYNGGGETLESYGLDAPAALAGPGRHAGWRAVLLLPEAEQRRLCQDMQAGLRARLPPAHERFLRTLPHSWQSGGFFFAHAGINPDRPLDDQKPGDLMWIRDRFLHAGRDHGRVIVHGHTPAPAPTVRANRIGIDTGACCTGRLTCLRLDADGAAFLTA